ncbi:hypothetical protein [Sinorhizobium meliloti]|uniref:hypothetical protein n=1 Tax=Rhizobium meliloti TaxID=382 RepID=UPI000FDB0F08|nr:hypothetical protein [Sinorhizobium meliloti]MQX43998.1 hypothetical protein [Sinorhizobium meliloti]
MLIEISSAWFGRDFLNEQFTGNWYAYAVHNRHDVEKQPHLHCSPSQCQRLKSLIRTFGIHEVANSLCRQGWSLEDSRFRGMVVIPAPHRRALAARLSERILATTSA